MFRERLLWFTNIYEQKNTNISSRGTALRYLQLRRCLQMKRTKINFRAPLGMNLHLLISETHCQMLSTFNRIIKRRTENKYKNKEDWKLDYPISVKQQNLTGNELTMLYDMICSKKDIFYWEKGLSSIICFYIYKVLLKWKWI